MVSDRSADGPDAATLLSLNPCFNGRWSLTHLDVEVPKLHPEVLILVLMEDGL